jgi:hypothetical protein
MNIRLLSASSREYAPLVLVTGQTKIDYALRHGYDAKHAWHECPTNLIDIGWDRPKVWLEHLQQCDWLFFTGADAAITNLDRPLDSFLALEADFIFSVSHHDKALQCDSWIMRNCPATVSMLRRVCLMRGYADCNNEQDALQVCIAGTDNFGQLRNKVDNHENLLHVYNGADVRSAVVHPRSLNALPMAEYGGTGEEPWSWRPGDFVMHLSLKSLAERLALFSKYL